MATNPRRHRVLIHETGSGPPPDLEDAAVVVFWLRVPPRTRSAPAHDPLDADETRMDLSRGVVIELAPGDVAFMHSLTPHRSAPNRGTQSRRALIITYAAARHSGLAARYERKRGESSASTPAAAPI